MSYPILYSFRRCPYAMRARMAIAYSEIQVELREVTLKNKPEALLQASAKATVPVLVLESDEVIDESLDIMLWALSIHDPDNWIGNLEKASHLITENDSVFKTHLDHYKYADRHPEHSAEYYRSQGKAFLSQLESLLSSSKYLSGPELSIIDIALFPFIRQFSHVDKAWFDQAPYPLLQGWLAALLNSTLFAKTMEKQPVWEPGQSPLLFNGQATPRH
jgi:glutathione S-transferase